MFGWLPVSGAASYRVEVAGQGGYDPPLVVRTTVNRWLTLAEAVPPGPRAWRVAALDGAGVPGPWSEATFTLDRVLATPVLSPAIVTATWPDDARVIEWEPVEGAEGYDVRLTTGPPESIDDNGDGFAWSGTRHVVNPAVANVALGPVMYWQVRARGPGGLAHSAWSVLGELRSSWPQAPTPVTPDGASMIEPVLDWEPLPGATRYAVEIEPLDGQGSPATLGATASVLSIVDHPDLGWFKGDARLGDLRWRVQGVSVASVTDLAFSSPWSAWRTITVVRPGAPALLAPAHGLTAPGAPRMAWSPVPRTRGYEVQLSRDPGFAGDVVLEFTDDTALEAGTWAVYQSGVRWDAPPAFDDGATWYWRVRASGMFPVSPGSGWSAVRSFTVDAPPIAVYAPADGATVEVPTLTWDASRGIAFEVRVEDRHGTPVAVGRTSAGRWTPRVRLDPADGPFTWWVEARDLRDADAVLASSVPRTFDVEPPAATATEPVILDPPAGEPNLTFAWTPVAGADHYDIVVSAPDSDGDDPLNREGPLQYPAFTHPGSWISLADPMPDPDGYSTWRVIAYAADGTEISRGPRREIRQGALATPEVLGPAACDSAGCGTPTSPTFAWTAVPHASHYVMWAGDMPPVTVFGTSARIVTTTWNGEGRWDWRVRACSYSGCSAPTPARSYWWSRIRPELSGPGDGATVFDEVTTSLEGGTPPSAPPGEEPAWTYQDERFLQQAQAWVAADDAYEMSWGFPNNWGPTRSFTMRATPSARVAPAEGAVVDATPLLRWTPAAGVRGYAVEIHHGGTGPLGPDTLVDTVGVYGSAFSPSAPLEPGAYRWRVRRATIGYAFEPWAGAAWSDAWTFSVPAAQPAQLLGPPDGATRTPADLLFEWTPVPGASAYRVELSRDPAFGALGYTASSATPAWAPGAPLSGGPWHWRVVAVSAGDGAISTSAGRAVTIDAPVVKPLRNAIVIDGGSAFAGWHDVRVTFPVAAVTGARHVRLSNDGLSWETRPWPGGPVWWEMAPGAVDLPNGQTTASDGAYTVFGQWEDLDGNWSAVASDTVVLDTRLPSATLTLDGGAATTGDAEVLLDVDVADADGAGALWVCTEDGCRYVLGGGPIPWRLGDADGPPGARGVCVTAYDVYGHWATGQACATIELTGHGTPASAPGPIGLEVAVGQFAPTHWSASETMAATPAFPAGRAPVASDTCTWELRWGDHAALRDAAVNGSGGGVMTSGTAAEGFCDGWSFTLPATTSGVATLALAVRRADGTLVSATPLSWQDRPRFRIVGRDGAPAAITASSLPLVNLAVEGSDEPGEPVTFSATPLGFAPSGAILSARSPTGTIATSANGMSLTVAAPEEGRWSVRWSGLRGGANVAAFLDPTASMLDVAPPQVTPPLARPRAGLALGSTVPVRLSWSGTDTGAGVAAYELEVSRNGGAWTSVRLPAAAPTAVDLSLARTGSYRYRVRPVDRAGNRGSWATGPVLRPTLIGDSSAVVRGSWRRTYSSSYLGGSVRYSTARGASASYAFTGSAIAWVAHRGPSRGRASVYLDGKLVTTVNLRADSVQARRMVFTHAWPTVGRHTIRIVVSGTAGHPRVDVDGFVVVR